MISPPSETPSGSCSADLMLPTDPPDHAKINLVQEHLAKVARFCRTIEEHMTPDLYRGTLPG